MMQKADYAARYPAAMRKVQLRLPEDTIVWAGGQQFGHSIQWLLIIGAFGAFCYGFAWLMDAHLRRLMPDPAYMPWLLHQGVAWIASHVFAVYVVAVICFALMGLIALSAWRMLYVLTNRHIVMMSKGGKGLFTVFPLNNMLSCEVVGINKQGAGDIRIKFMEPVQTGRMERRGCTLNAVAGAEAVAQLIAAHIAVQAE